ncbi:hypothetical protein DW355_09845 [Hylemonella gracilis]|uniref:DUF2306 domain-containing protein n=1 Tax=Hylemonella gracilis TaxID=80880 RepID=A0A4P6UIU1_9BURK|nr:hypothetical protein [Hylemonella gracilis]QBK05032.1 hypothetical protein DW355_09845 [Hylemonella gracilis]
MPNPLSTLGIAHTLISLAPVVAGLYGFVRFRRIDPSAPSGQVYLWGLTLAVFTSFGLSSKGGINPGHVLGVLALLAAFGGAWLAPRLRFLGRLAPHLQNFGLSFSFFLLMVPGINETLSRLPVAQPVATGPEDPVVQTALLVWLLVFVVGFALQCLAFRGANRTENPMSGSTARP